MISKKNFIAIALLIGLLITLPSCKKNYVCKCENTNTIDGSTHTSFINMEGRNKNSVESDCKNMSAYWSITRECSLN